MADHSANVEDQSPVGKGLALSTSVPRQHNLKPNSRNLQAMRTKRKPSESILEKIMQQNPEDQSQIPMLKRWFEKTEVRRKDSEGSQIHLMADMRLNQGNYRIITIK